MARRNASIYAAAIENAESKRILSDDTQPETKIDEKQVKLKALTDRMLPIQEFRSLPEQIARSTMFYRNHYYTDNSRFPYEEKYRRVDFFFPQTEYGPLFIDMVKTDSDRDVSERKLPVIQEMKKAKFIILEHDDTFFEAMERIEKSGVLK